jgi:hypothetical protein
MRGVLRPAAHALSVGQLTPVSWLTRYNDIPASFSFLPKFVIFLFAILLFFFDDLKKSGSGLGFMRKKGEMKE